MLTYEIHLRLRKNNLRGSKIKILIFWGHTPTPPPLDGTFRVLSYEPPPISGLDM